MIYNYLSYFSGKRGIFVKYLLLRQFFHFIENEGMYLLLWHGNIVTDFGEAKQSCLVVKSERNFQVLYSFDKYLENGVCFSKYILFIVSVAVFVPVSHFGRTLSREHVFAFHLSSNSSSLQGKYLLRVDTSKPYPEFHKGCAHVCDIVMDS